MVKYEDIKVELIDHMGSDLTVVNAARVSFDKESKWEYQNFDELELTEEYAEKNLAYVDYDYIYSDRWMGGFPVKYLSEKDEKLIKYLASHNHWTPFSHPQIQFRVTVPFAVARQLDKHQIGGTRNEISRRYVDSEPTFYKPESWRKKSENKKQGSSETEIVNMDEMLTMEGEHGIIHLPEELLEISLETYNTMIKMGVAPEQARFVLPMCTMTQYYWTMSLATAARICKLRLSSDSQFETRIAAKQIYDITKNIFPISMKYLVS